MKKIIVTVPFGYQITETEYIKSFKSKEFTEENSLKDILDFIEKVNKEIGIEACIISTISDL